MKQIRFRARLGAPRLAEAPPEVVAKRRNSMIASRQKTYRGTKKSVKTRKDFDQKIGQPILDSQQSFIKPSFVSRSGLTKKDIIYKTQDRLKRAFPEYKKGLKLYYESEEFQEMVDFSMRWFVKDYLRYTVPLKGHNKGRIKGLVYLGVMSLLGAKDLPDFLKDTDKMEGQPLCITSPAKKGQFRNALTNQLLRSGRVIIRSGYDPEKIRKENEVINRLVEKYRLPEFAPFSPGGPSHIDFVVISAKGGSASGGDGNLYLDIQVATK